QSGYNFIYTDNLLRMAKPVQINVNEADFEEVLKQIFNDQPLTYTIHKNTVTVREKKMFFSYNVEDEEVEMADIVVTGKITDAKGESLPGVSVRVKGTNIGTSADLDGRYSLSVDENAILVFTYIGYVTQEVAVNNRS